MTPFNLYKQSTYLILYLSSAIISNYFKITSSFRLYLRGMLFICPTGLEKSQEVAALEIFWQI